MTQPTHNGDPLFLGAYPSYHALWHLNEIGVLNMDPADPDGGTYLADSPLFQAESAARKKTVIALIDTSVAWDHPCLKDSINHDLMIDFAGEPLGAFVTGAPGEVPAKLRDLDLRSYGDDYINAAAARLKARFDAPPMGLGRAAASQKHATHGTAMAGIIGARPTDVKVHRSTMLNPAAAAAPMDLPLRYTGVNPFCEIVPISTSAMPTPEEMIHALLYAEMIGAHMVVLAASLPTPDSIALVDSARTPNEIDTQSLRTRAMAKPQSVLDGEAALHKLLEKIGEHRPVLCAAGNDGSGRAAYPARMARKDNGIVAIGAYTANGQPCAYTPEDADSITLFAPSGDVEKLQRSSDGGYDLRLDPYRLRYDHRNDQGLFDQITDAAGALDHSRLMAPQQIMTTDVPGPNGYNPSAYLQDPFASDDGTDTYLDPSSLFCTFSGTSAATAIAAGMISLAMAMGHLHRGGPRFDPETFKSDLRGRGDSDYAAATPKLSWD
jgi:subtilisin family serine protease